MTAGSRKSTRCRDLSGVVSQYYPFTEMVVFGNASLEIPETLAKWSYFGNFEGCIPEIT